MNISKGRLSGRADNYQAKYLVVLGGGGSARALLFDQDRRYLAEVIDDDGVVLDNLMRAGTACSAPVDLPIHSLARAAVAMRCFTLG
ncbi:MAG: hypothetical protein ABI605_21420 [Rhizobacter sp.]